MPGRLAEAGERAALCGVTSTCKVRGSESSRAKLAGVGGMPVSRMTMTSASMV
jgi:hypothetical protein